MSIMEMETKARELQELKRMREELEAEITSIEDAIKAAMGDSESVTAGAYKDHLEAHRKHQAGR